jgi:hypothetical protein
MGKLKIELSNLIERFAENSREFSISKKTNFVFGRNGTGKTTIADAIKDKFSNDYNVCVFKDFVGVVDDNSRLNAVALGTKNAEIQVQIETLDREIVEIKKEIENLFTKEKKASENYNQQYNKIDDFFADSAKNIKNQTNPQVALATYNKNDFENEVSKAKLLSEDETTKHKDTIKSDEKKEKVVNKIIFPNLDLSERLKSTNEILQSNVSQQQIIDELKDNADKQNFAKQRYGLYIKMAKNAPFAVMRISEERWRLLGSYFNDKVKKLEDLIKQAVDKINSELKKLSRDVKEISKNDFFEKFADQIEALNLQIKNNKMDIKEFLETLRTALEEKVRNLFTKSKKSGIDIPENFTDIKISYDKIVEENNNFRQNLNQEKEKAKDALRYHEIKKALEYFKYEDENNKLTKLKTVQEEAQKSLNEKESQRDKKKEEKKKLISQTKDENRIAEQINNCLRNMGVTSFSLELVNNKEENQKGQYQIKDHNGTHKVKYGREKHYCFPLLHFCA